jgi:hypothetical protein
MADTDLDEFFQKVGCEHDPHRVTMCRRETSYAGIKLWTCTALVTDNPDIATTPCHICHRGLIICTCEMAPEKGWDYCTAGEGEYGCPHDPTS